MLTVDRMLFNLDGNIIKTILYCCNREIKPLGFKHKRDQVIFRYRFFIVFRNLKEADSFFTFSKMTYINKTFSHKPDYVNPSNQYNYLYRGT